MVRTYMRLLTANFNVNKEKFYAFLHLHGYHNERTQKQFWSKVTGIPTERIKIYNKPNTGKNVREGYPGCIAVRYGDVLVAKEIEFLYTALVRKFGR